MLMHLVPIRIYVLRSDGRLLHFDGTSWTTSTAPPTPGFYNALHVLNESNIYVLKEAKEVMHYDGTNWQLMDTGVTQFWNDIFAIATDDIYVVGNDGTILHYSGSTWTPMASGTTNVLLSVFATNSTNVYVGGYTGCLYRGDGTSFTSANTGKYYNVYTIDGTDANNIYASGSQASVIHFNGTAWNDMKITDSYGNLYGLSVIDNNNIYAAGGAGIVLRYDGCSKSGALPSSEQPENADVEIVNTVENMRNATWVQTNYDTPTEFVPQTTVREFTATTSQGNGTAIFGFRFTDIETTVDNLYLVKLFDNSTNTLWNMYDKNGDVSSPEGAWWVMDTSGVRLDLTDSVAADQYYDLRFVLKDNGVYDLDPRTGFIRDPQVLGVGWTPSSPASGDDDDDGHGHGCTMSESNSVTLLALLPLAAIMILLRRRFAQRQQ